MHDLVDENVDCSQTRGVNRSAQLVNGSLVVFKDFGEQIRSLVERVDSVAKCLTLGPADVHVVHAKGASHNGRFNRVSGREQGIGSLRTVLVLASSQERD